MSNNYISPVGDSWESYKETILTAEERRDIDIKVQLVSEILHARQAQGFTQKQLSVCMKGRGQRSSYNLPPEM